MRRELRMAAFLLPMLAGTMPFPAQVSAAGTNAVFVASPRDSAKARRIYRQGLEPFRHGRYAEARRIFRQSTFTGVELPEALFAEGLCALHLGDPKAAIPLLERGLELDPADAQAHYNLGLALRGTPGRAVDARTHLERAVKLDSTLTGAHLELARIDDQAGEHAAALREARRAVATAPADAAVPRAELGLVWLHAGRPDSALSWFDAALAADPGLFEAHVQRGRALDALGRPGEAADAWKAALAIDSTRADLWAARGRAELLSGATEAAATSLRHATELNPADARSAYNLGLALDRSGRHDEALDAYREAARRDTTWADPHYNAGALLARLDRYGEARDELMRYLALSKDSKRAAEVRTQLEQLPGGAEGRH